MKNLIVLLVVILLTAASQNYGQALTERKSYSKNVKAEIAVKIRLPEGFSKTEKYLAMALS